MSGLNFKTKEYLDKEKEKENQRKRDEKLRAKTSLASNTTESQASDSKKIPSTSDNIDKGMSLAKTGAGLLSKGTNALKGVSPNTMGAADKAGQMVAGIVDPEGEGPATVASTALTGASIGSVVPGIGTAIGAVVGLGLGLIKAESNKKKNQAAREAKSAEIMGNALQRQSVFNPIRLGSLNTANRDLKF